ncbi:MAG: GNAT family N-acetyltransferase [Lachnospiraceae bacterium]|nr:GNAT family N-acetyltransferase [Lachnospiraceae bacterium]
MNYLEPIDKALRIESERLLLRPLTEEDTDVVLKLRNSDYVRDNFFYRHIITPEEHLKYFREKCETGAVHYFIVEEKETGDVIGVVYLQHYDDVEKTMESGIFLSKSAPKGKGYATECYGTLVWYGFTKLNLKKQFCRVIADNKASLRMNEKLGYEEVDRGLEKIIPSGEMVEAVTLEVSKETFFKKHNFGPDKHLPDFYVRMYEL